MMKVHFRWHQNKIHKTIFIIKLYVACETFVILLDLQSLPHPFWWTTSWMLWCNTSKWSSWVFYILTHKMVGRHLFYYPWVSWVLLPPLELGQDQESEKHGDNGEDRCGEWRGATVAAVLLASTVEHLDLKLKMMLFWE